MDGILMAPSVLSADFTRLAEAVSLIEEAGGDLVHVDVMDGHFVPNLTVGPPVIRALKRSTGLPLDVHLMIDNADRTVDWYLDAGADYVTVHVEASPHLHRTVQTIKAAGAKAGVSLNPATPIETLTEILPEVDLVLVMSVNPGFGGQAFIPAAVERIGRLRSLCARFGCSPTIEVDGGIDVATAPKVVRAGARALVAGAAVFGQDDPKAALQAIREAAMRELAV